LLLLFLSIYIQAASERTALAREQGAAMLEFQQGKYAVEQVASLSQLLSSQQDSLRNARATLREMEKENDENSLDEEEYADARSMIEFWKGMCEETKASLRHQSVNVVGTVAAVLPVKPARKTSTRTNPGKAVIDVDTSNKSSSSEAGSCDSSVDS
jgi:small-conductance mechanosensitive channel